MLIKFPKLERIVFGQSVVKNQIIQLLQPENKIQIANPTQTRSGLAFQIGAEQYYMTCNKNDCPQDKEFILLTTSKPTIERIQNGELKIKKWLKHPSLIEHTPDAVLRSWANAFQYKEEDIANNIKGLRQPQIGALHHIMGHLKLPLDIATVVLPTGTGKTETMLSALVANRCKRLLVIVPSDSLRRQISQKFISLGLLKEFGIVNQEALLPIVGIIRQGFNTSEGLQEFAQGCNVLVTTMSILAGFTPEQNELMKNNISNVFIDEAHHVKASTWDSFKNNFSKDKLIQFTATPFRNDGKRLDGKIIFNFPLSEAQRQGYFQRINFITVREFDSDEADKKIAETAIEKLRQDRANNFNHILMARCGTKERAKAVFKLYEDNTDLNPVLIYSNAPDFKDNYEKIIKKEAKIIVCVDMLGEGFDLPELKVAAFHDIRKSLPITLQFAGRFTRTKHDEELGEASFIANIADLTVRAELADLYAMDADWNQLLSDASFGRIENEVEFKDMMEGFVNLKNSKIPFQNIKTKFSTVVYKNHTNEWSPSKFFEAIPRYEELEYKFHDINRDENMLVIITAEKVNLDWVNHKDIYLVDWKLIVVYWETRNNLLFINSSDNSSLYQDLAKAIIGDEAELIRGIDVFKAFHNIKRIRLQNVGLRQFLGKDIRFRMMVGFDVAEALSIAEEQRGEKAFVMGIGFEEGDPVNIGSSYKGRIWSKLEGDLKRFKDWCVALGDKLADPAIDPNQILKETLIPTRITEIPSANPVWIDWDLEMYQSVETKFKFNINGFEYDLSKIELALSTPPTINSIPFILKSEDRTVGFELQLFVNNSNGNTYPDFRVIKTDASIVNVNYGARTKEAHKFFEEFIPTIWFADGSALTGNELVGLRHSITPFPREQLITMDWNGVDISAESQHVNPLVVNSIQYKMIQQLITEDFDIIYDDDYSGEIADLVAIKQFSDKIKINLYHLKYALGGVVSNQIKNLYEVCGQAQKSILWKHKSGNEFFNHLLRRQVKTKTGSTRSRIEKGTTQDLGKLLSIAKKEIPMEFEIFIVQPGVSKNSATPEMLTLLGVTENYIKEIAGINLKVIVSD